MNDGRDASVLDDFLGQRPGAAWRPIARWIAVALIAGLLILLFARFVSGGSPANYLSEPVVRDDLPLRISGTGHLLPMATRPIGPDLDGTITAVFVRPGQAIAAGQRLASIDPAPLQEALADSTALADARQQTLAEAEARAATLQSTLNRFEAVRRRSDGLVPSDREMATARADLDRANEAVRAARLEIARATADLAARRSQLAATDIRAPIAGIVLQARARPGMRIKAGPNAQPLFVLAEGLSRLRLDLAPTAGLGNSLKTGQTVRLAFARFPGRRFTATVRQAPPATAASAPVGAGALSLEVANAGLALRPGQDVSVQVDLGVRQDRLLVPDAALRFAEASGLARDVEAKAGAGAKADHSGSVLVLKEDGTPRRVPVTLGGGDGQRTEVTSDTLEPGARVIVGLR